MADPRTASSGAYHRSRRAAGYVFAAPWLIGLLLFVLLPIIITFLLSFTRYNLINPPRWIGLTNYRSMLFLDPTFWKSIGNTLYYVVGSVFLKVFLSLILAVLLNTPRRGMRLLRTVYFLPVVLPAVPVMLLWMNMFNPNTGIINQVLGWFGIAGPLWLGSPGWAKPAMVIMSLWGVGGIIVIFLAGLQDIPEHLYEAAELDGASGWTRFRHITVPLLVPVILFTLVTGIVGASQVFAEAYVMTGGGPLESTTFVNLLIYRLAFRQGQMGYASAMAWFMFVLLVPITLALFKVSGRWMGRQT